MIEDDDSEEGQKSREARIKKPDIEARIKASIREARIKKPDIEARIKASMEAYTQRKVEQQRLSKRWAWNYFTKMSRNDAEEVDEHTTLLPLFYGTYHCNGTSYYLGSNDTLYDMMTHELVGNIND